MHFGITRQIMLSSSLFYASSKTASFCLTHHYAHYKRWKENAF